MEEMTKHGKLGRAAMKAGMDRKTARKYVGAGRLPSELRAPRDWRTRPDPFDEHWPEVQARLEETPELEAKTLFEVLCEEHPDRYADGQLRTLQRRVKAWRAAHGPDQEVVLGQRHRPGEAAQTDFTRAAELGVTVMGEVFVHLLCVLRAAVLELVLGDGVPVGVDGRAAAGRAGGGLPAGAGAALPSDRQLDGRDPPHPPGCCEPSQTSRGPASGRSTTSTVALMRHFGMSRGPPRSAPRSRTATWSRTTARSSVLEQALLLRGSRDFESRDAWEAFVDRGRAASTTGAAGPRSPRNSPRCEPLRAVDGSPSSSEAPRPGQRLEHGPSQALRLLGAVAAHRRGLASGSTRSGWRRFGGSSSSRASGCGAATCTASTTAT
jgi:hypothetical protein